MAVNFPQHASEKSIGISCFFNQVSVSKCAEDGPQSVAAGLPLLPRAARAAAMCVAAAGSSARDCTRFGLVSIGAFHYCAFVIGALVAVSMSGASRESALIGRSCQFTHPEDGASAR